MPDEYSLYDAKAKLSALIRQVREGSSFIITVHGQPVAELRPITPPAAGVQTLAARIAELSEKGEIVQSKKRAKSRRPWPIGEPRPGALARFLEERD
jgi:prevent-host-death family protein